MSHEPVSDQLMRDLNGNSRFHSTKIYKNRNFEDPQLDNDHAVPVRIVMYDGVGSNVDGWRRRLGRSGRSTARGEHSQYRLFRNLSTTCILTSQFTSSIVVLFGNNPCNRS
jgi:hypothetical protein